MRITAGYVRISLDTDESTSVEAQTSILEKWAAAQDVKLELYIDRGISGSKDVLRPQFERLRLDVTSGLVDKIVVKSADRLSRNLRKFVEFADEAKQHNTTIFAVEQGIDTGTAVGVLMLQLLSTFAEFEATQISQRQTTSQAHRRTLGRSTNLPPIGYRSITRDGGQYLELDPEHAPTVRALVDGILAGDSMWAVAKTLNSQGLLPKSGKQWTSASVGKVAQNPRLVGMTKDGDDVVRDSKGLPRIEEHLQIVSLSEWQEMQKLRATRASQHPHGPGHERQLLYGLARCQNCGRLLLRDTASRYSRYRCVGWSQQKRACDAPTIMADHRLDEYVTNEIQPFLDMPATTFERTQDPVALQKRMLYDAEITALTSTMGALPPTGIAEAAGRLTTLIEQRDAVQVDEVVTQIETGETLRDWWATEPSRVLAMMIEQVIVSRGRLPVKDRVEIVWRENEAY